MPRYMIVYVAESLASSACSFHRLTDCRPESVPVDDHNLDHEHRITHTLANSDSRSLFVSDIVVNSTA